MGSSRVYTPIKRVDDHTRNGWGMQEWYQVMSPIKTPNIIGSDNIWKLTLRHDVGLFWTQSTRSLIFLAIKVSMALHCYSS